MGFVTEIYHDRAIAEARNPGATFVEKSAVGPSHEEVRMWPNDDGDKSTSVENPMVRVRAANGVWGDSELFTQPVAPSVLPWDGCPCAGCKYLRGVERAD